MSLPIASITCTITAKKITSEDAQGGKIYKIIGLIHNDDENSICLVKTYQKDGSFLQEDLQYVVVGTPSKVGDANLSIDARVVTPVKDVIDFADLTIGGRLGGDAQTKTFANGEVHNLNIAVKSMKETSWFSASLWGKQPDFMTGALVKGAAVVASGSVKFEIYENKQGKTVKKLSVQTRRIDLLGKSFSSGDTNGNSHQEPTVSAPAQSDNWDEIAF